MKAAKRLGAKGRLPKDIDYAKLGVDEQEATRIERKLMGKKRCISKHCGGVLVFDRALPKVYSVMTILYYLTKMK